MPDVTTETVTVPMPDGGSMDGHLALPAAGHGPGIVVVMEVFGVGAYIREATERLAGIGYVALAPDLYRRTRPGAVFGRSDAELEAAMAAAGELDHDAAVVDAGVAMDHLRGRREVTGGIGALGFCLGGTLALELAVASDPATTVSYYGSGIPELLAPADGGPGADARIDCPVLMQWGADDPFVPVAQAREACAVAATHPGWECHIQRDGGHAFDNWDNPRFSRPPAAARAWEQTRAFLARTLPLT